MKKKTIAIELKKLLNETATRVLIENFEDSEQVMTREDENLLIESLVLLGKLKKQNKSLYYYLVNHLNAGYSHYD